jgi:hypothetical protein
MDILRIILYVYLGFGLLYGIYLLLFGDDKWYMFPINVLGGPVVFVYLLIISAFTNKELKSR